MSKKAIIFLAFVFCCFGTTVSAQEETGTKNPLMLFFPIGYDGLWLEDQTVHSPFGGIGFMFGKHGLPFNQVERRFFGMAMYQPFILSDAPLSELPTYYHEIKGMFDGRIGRHQILGIFRTRTDDPVSSGFKAFRIGTGWGYEVIRQPQISLILGAALHFGDLTASSLWDKPLYVMPSPLIRFGIDTKWLSSSIDYYGVPMFSFTVAPQERIRLTGNMQMEKYRSISDLDCAFTLWYRFFAPDHKIRGREIGDIAGVGIGFKNTVKYFDLSPETPMDTFDIQQSSIFGILDISLLKFQCGWVFNSNYLVDSEKIISPGRGFFLSVQGSIPIRLR